jgi:DNA-binding CsgD family transcriptional regulator
LVKLRAAGARLRRIRRSGVDTLTASERRVAEMAATGMTNRDIAQALFVTLRTVEVHLTHAYAKLRYLRPPELAGALTDLTLSDHRASTGNIRHIRPQYGS